MKNVLLFWENPLFLETMQLLLKHPNINFVGSQISSTLPIDEIKLQRPSIVIVEKTENGIPLKVEEVFEQTSWNMRILELSLSDNELCVYQHQHTTIGHPGDLLNFILD